MPLWESHFHKRDHFLIVQSMGEGGKDRKMNSSHHQVLLVEQGLSGWLRAKVKMTMQTQLTSDHTYTTTCGVCQTMQENIALHCSYQIAFILWSGGSGHFMQWELCNREIRRELLQRAQFMNAVNIRGMKHLVTSSCFSSWMLSESDYDKTRERKRQRRARRERDCINVNSTHSWTMPPPQWDNFLSKLQSKLPKHFSNNINSTAPRGELFYPSGFCQPILSFILSCKIALLMSSTLTFNHKFKGCRTEGIFLFREQ